MHKAPYNPNRTVIPTPSWPYGRCETCGKDTMVDCHACGQCVTEMNQP